MYISREMWEQIGKHSYLVFNVVYIPLSFGFHKIERISNLIAIQAIQWSALVVHSFTRIPLIIL